MADFISRADVLALLLANAATAKDLDLIHNIEDLPSGLPAPINSIERLLSDVGSYHPDCTTFNPKSPE